MIQIRFKVFGCQPFVLSLVEIRAFGLLTVCSHIPILDYKSTAGDDLDDVDTTKLVRMDLWLIGSITESFIIIFSKLVPSVGSEGKRSTRDNA